MLMRDDKMTKRRRRKIEQREMFTQQHIYSNFIHLLHLEIIEPSGHRHLLSLVVVSPSWFQVSWLSLPASQTCPVLLTPFPDAHLSSVRLGWFCLNHQCGCLNRQRRGVS
jgi:hypothetical protein